MAVASGNEIRLGAQGRIVIPAHLRKALSLEPGDRLIARQEGSCIVLERRRDIERRLWSLFSHIPSEVSLAEELIADRRKEAKRELER